MSNPILFVIPSFSEHILHSDQLSNSDQCECLNFTQICVYSVFRNNLCTVSKVKICSDELILLSEEFILLFDELIFSFDLKIPVVGLRN